MFQITVNGRKVDVSNGETLLDGIRRSGVHVPTLCHLQGLTPTGACRLCSVEVEGRGNLVPSCAFPAQDGMVVHTHSQRAVAARKAIVELLLADHPDDCNYCERNGACELQDLARQFGIRERAYAGSRTHCPLDVSSPSLIRDPEKCILCGRCVRVCEEVQAVGAIDFIGRGSTTRIGAAFDEGLNVSSCVGCGQCIVVCPTGALTEHPQIRSLDQALRDPDTFVVAQHAPAVSVTLAEEFGLKRGSDINGVMTAALRRLGVDRVFETSFAADLTVMEEATELLSRLQGDGKLPMMTSCSPGWVKYVETFFPEMTGHLSSCKSPQQMLGAVIKSYFAEREGIDPSKVFSVAVMPCTAKKFEASRPEMLTDGTPDVDAVLTTRELARLINSYDLDLSAIPPEAADTPFGERSSSGKLFGASGGVMEASLRTAQYLATGDELDKAKIPALRGLKHRKEAKVRVNGTELGVAVVSGLEHARALMEEIRAGRDDLHFIEVMGCPGGCVGGGGQPIGADVDAVKARMQALYQIDRDEELRLSHRNRSVQRLYDEFLGEPAGETSHRLLHTNYVQREVLT